MILENEKSHIAIEFTDRGNESQDMRVEIDADEEQVVMAIMDMSAYLSDEIYFGMMEALESIEKRKARIYPDVEVVH